MNQCYKLQNGASTMRAHHALMNGMKLDKGIYGHKVYAS